MLPVVASSPVIQEMHRAVRATSNEAHDLVMRLFALHRVETLALRFGNLDKDPEARERDAAALLLALPRSEIIVGPDELVVLSPEPLDDESLRRCLWSSSRSSAQAYVHGSCVHFDAAARDAILELLDDGARTVRGTLATQLGAHWVYIDDREGLIYDALIAGIADDALQPGVLQTIQQQVRSFRLRTRLKCKRPADASLRALLRAILADADTTNAFDAVGALIAINDVEPVLAYWNSPDVEMRDPYVSVRKKIAEALADFGGPDELELLRSFVADSKLDPALRRASLSALDERSEAGNAARYEREIDDALARSKNGSG